jgi:cobalt-zinc-cadmium efflux system membrane fusion protein
MNRQFLSLLILGLALIAWQITPTVAMAGKAAHDSHSDHGDNHDDHDSHKEHGEEHSEAVDARDDHANHGHHNHEEKDSHDDHGHGAHEEHEEGTTEITAGAAKQAGVKIEETAPAMIANIIPLTGRITIDQNAKAEVRARFPGIIRKVNVNWGDLVEKGQVLAVVESNESLKDYSITAPINGTILERNTNLGDVASSEPLFTIADLSTVWAKFHIFPKDAEMVTTQQNVRVHTLDESKEDNATLTMLVPMADALSQTLVTIAPLNNEDSQGTVKWRPGMTVEGDVTVSEKRVALAVRESALQTMEDQIVVFIKHGDSYEMKAVTTGVSDGTYIEIISGISAGQFYVSEGSFIIKADILKSGAAHDH